MKKTLKIGISVLLSFVLALTVVLLVFSHKTPEAPSVGDGNGGAIIGEFEGENISVVSRKLARSEFADYSVSPLAEDAYTLKATVLPADASDKTLDWSVTFVNSESEWATGKTVTDYVTVTPVSDDTLTATVSCLKDFGEQIIVTATSRDNPDATATCTVDYRKRVKNFNISLAGNVFEGANYTTKSPINFKEKLLQVASLSNITFSEYTIDVEYTRMSLNIALTPEFRKAAGLSDDLFYYEIAKCDDISWVSGTSSFLIFDSMFSSLFEGMTDDSKTMQKLREVCSSLSEHFSYYLYWDVADTIAYRQTFKYDGGTFDLATFAPSVSSVEIDESEVVF